MKKDRWFKPLIKLSETQYQTVRFKTIFTLDQWQDVEEEEFCTYVGLNYFSQYETDVIGIFEVDLILPSLIPGYCLDYKQQVESVENFHLKRHRICIGGAGWRFFEKAKLVNVVKGIIEPMMDVTWNEDFLARHGYVVSSGQLL